VIAGTILYDDKFKFSDGLIGEKLLLTLCNGNMGYYIIVKTTSNGKHKVPFYGCHLEDRFQNFFYPKNHAVCIKIPGLC
jgi:hypothetical protein